MSAAEDRGWFKVDASPAAHAFMDGLYAVALCGVICTRPSVWRKVEKGQEDVVFCEPCTRGLAALALERRGSGS